MRHLDGLCLHGIAGRGHPLLVGVLHHLRQEVRLQRVEHVEEVISGWALALWIFVWKVGHEDGILLEHREHGLHRKLIVVGNGHFVVIRLLEQLLLAFEDVFQEIFGHHRLVREIELETTMGSDKR